MNSIKKISTLIIIAFFIGNSCLVFSNGDGGEYVVVLDAGHGGKDSGARGSMSMEKDIVLDISKQVGHYLSAHLENVKVIYTRDDDTFVELYKRAEIANKNEADLFVSIHANASPSKRPYGTETFVMGLHKTESNLEVAQKENAVITLEEDYTERYEGYDPHSAESYIIFSLMQNTFLEQSLRAAELIQKEFREKARRKDRGVKQAGFLVLWNTSMPSVLVETGFISNSREETYLNSEQGKDYLASAIFRAIRAFLEELEKSQAPDISYEQNSKDKNTDEIAEENEIRFMVQLTASSQLADTTSKTFSQYSKQLKVIKIGQYYKYYFGEVGTYAEAKELQKKCENDFPDAFIVAFQGKRPISIKDAINQQ